MDTPSDNPSPAAAQDIATLQREIEGLLHQLAQVAVRHNVALNCAVGVAVAQDGKIIGKPFGKVASCHTHDQTPGSLSYANAINGVAAVHALEASEVNSRGLQLREMERDLRKLIGVHVKRLRVAKPC